MHACVLGWRGKVLIGAVERPRRRVPVVCAGRVRDATYLSDMAAVGPSGGAAGNTRSWSFREQFLAGATSGVVKCFFTYPLDQLKGQVQMSSEKHVSMASTTRWIYRQRGLRGFYVGASAAYWEQIGKVGIQFVSWEYWYLAAAHAHRFLRPLPSDTHTLAEHTTFSLFAGFMAGATEALLWTTPMERLKMIQQSELAKERGRSAVRRKTIGTIRAIRATFVQQGFPGFFQGLVPTSLRQGSSLALRFALFSNIKRALEDYSTSTRPWHAPLAGLSCGVLASLANNPIDVVKTRVQSQDPRDAHRRYRGTYQTLLLIFREEGLRALYKGVWPRALKLGAGQMVVFTGYTHLLNRFLRDGKHGGRSNL
jgi:hypothetical protein